MAAIQNLCSRCILLHEGSVRIDGAPDQVINHYISQVMPSEVTDETLATEKNRSGTGAVRFTRFHLEDPKGNEIQCAMSGMDVTFVFSYQVTPGNWPKRVDVGFSIHTGADQLLFVLYSSYAAHYLDPPGDTGCFRCRIKKLPLSAGRYLVGARIIADQDEADWPRNGVGYLDVEHGDFYGTGSSGFSGTAPFLVDGEWDVVGSDRAANLPEVVTK